MRNSDAVPASAEAYWLLARTQRKPRSCDFAVGASLRTVEGSNFVKLNVGRLLNAPPRAAFAWLFGPSRHHSQTLPSTSCKPCALAGKAPAGEGSFRISF